MKIVLKKKLSEYETIDTPFQTIPDNEKILYFNLHLTHVENNLDVVELDFSQVHLNTARAMTHINDLLLAVQQLHTIDLSNCKIDDDNGEILAQSLSRVTQLDYLNLSKNELSFKTYDKLAVSLPIRIRFLYLQNNLIPLTKKGQSDLRDCIQNVVEQYRSLTHLSVDFLNDASVLIYLNNLCVTRGSVKLAESTWTIPFLYVFKVDACPSGDLNQMHQIYERGRSQDVSIWLILLSSKLNPGVVRFLSTF